MNNVQLYLILVRNYDVDEKDLEKIVLFLIDAFVDKNHPGSHKMFYWKENE